MMIQFTVSLLIFLSSSAFVNAWTQEDILMIHAKVLLSQRELQHLRREFQGGDEYGATIHALFDNRDKIDRTVQVIENGIIATTTSTNQDVVSLLQTHVNDMKNLQWPIRQGDPLFVSLFDNIEQTNFDVHLIPNGVNVTNTGFTDCGVILVQEHATQITSFVDTGVRRPNFDWEEPDVCDNPQPLIETTMDSMRTMKPTETTTTILSTEDDSATMTTTPPTEPSRTPITPPAEQNTQELTSASSLRANKTVAIAVSVLSAFTSYFF